jgi:hypothetical protein
MYRLKAGLAVGMAAMLVLGGSGALAASPSPGPTDDPCGKTSATCSPADLAKARAAKEQALRDEAAKGDADKAAKATEDGKDQIVSECSSKAVLDPAELARALAAELGVGLEQATKAVETLDAESGRIEADSPEFRAAAEGLGVSADRLMQALGTIKRGHADLKGGTPKDVPSKEGTPKDVPSKEGVPDGAETPGS